MPTKGKIQPFSNVSLSLKGWLSERWVWMDLETFEKTLLFLLYFFHLSTTNTGNILKNPKINFKNIYDFKFGNNDIPFFCSTLIVIDLYIVKYVSVKTSMTWIGYTYKLISKESILSCLFLNVNNCCLEAAKAIGFYKFLCRLYWLYNTVKSFTYF